MDNQIHKNTGLGYALLHFYLYSSLHIAVCAMAITYFTYLNQLTNNDISYVYFVGASTLLLYSVHRIIGIRKSESYLNQGRFAIIAKYNSHLIIYSIAATIYCIYAYYNFSWTRRSLLVMPAVVSIAYSLPIFSGGRRLRDFHFIKIFLVAICWALITATIPVIENGHYEIWKISLITLERACFIFAITIPFDIRDRNVDKITGVLTLATSFSDSALKRISWISLLIAGVITVFLYHQEIYPMQSITPILLTYFITSFFIFLTNEKRSDYFFTGLIDGTMILPLFLFFAIKVAFILLKML